MFIYRFGLFLTLGLLSFATSYAGEIKFKFQEASNGVIQFRLIGAHLCDNGTAKSFTMTKGYVGQGAQFVRESQYVSKQGNDTWRVTNTCTINQQLTNDLLQPGKALKVQTYNEYGYELERFYIQIPCDKHFGTYAEEYLFSTDITQISATVCDSAGSDVAVVKDLKKDTVTVPSTPVIVPEVEKTQYCASEVSVNNSDRRRVDVKVGCSYQDRLRVTVIANNQIVYDRNVQITNSHTNKQLVVSLPGRDFAQHLEFQVRMNESFYFPGFGKVNYQTVAKDPTFLSFVRQNMISPRLVKPVAQEKHLGRGYYFDTEIQVFVRDMDIDSAYPEKQILVQLINTTNNQYQVVSEKYVTTEEKISFRVDGQYIIPFFWGSTKWDRDYVLQAGKNTFKVRTFDAYQQERYVDSEEITVELPHY